MTEYSRPRALAWAAPVLVGAFLLMWLSTGDLGEAGLLLLIAALSGLCVEVVRLVVSRVRGHA
ncbi:MAG TPA: hypothetical protein VG076_14775 [Acidimicrobiales bacterium]|jgi:hypothetical protein|nr:hypothetical protein [Acidimicrobiales bacterium]